MTQGLKRKSLKVNGYTVYLRKTKKTRSGEDLKTRGEPQFLVPCVNRLCKEKASVFENGSGWLTIKCLDHVNCASSIPVESMCRKYLSDMKARRPESIEETEWTILDINRLVKR